jgi:hypothetical protein
LLSRGDVEAISGQLWTEILSVVPLYVLVLDSLTFDINYKLMLRKTALIPNIRTSTDPKMQMGNKNCK